ncbi:hypothetical protein I316_03925 [Kwoniella heveanensis BCC8398]|uniref:Metallo-beta-lactamase domain-containing protein n=1 Tax=Kwoniella heveanensis BCC8398 TaxID=1296120 RepID=A0A1B9GTQ5_9TREE|nr:hypothetical protein I316_03925 [Kwoniella heveanensis BCC8398]
MSDQRLTIDPARRQPPIRKSTGTADRPFPQPKHVIGKPASSSSSDQPDGSVTFVGTATTLLHFPPFTILTDPNFLHKGDHVHLGPGVNSTRVTDPAIELEELPDIDVVLLSHYHEDHFDKEVEDKLRRDLPIITTPHAKKCLTEDKAVDEKFSEVYDVDTWQSMFVSAVRSSEGKDQGITGRSVKVTAMPGKHVPPGFLEKANDLLGAVPPTNGWMVELGSESHTSVFETGYRIYITGDTLLVDDLVSIPQRYSDAGKPIDLMIAHLGGTTIPSPSIPLLMVTMDGKMGVELIKLVKPEVTIPVHYDDYDVFASPLNDFKEEIKKAGLESKVVFLDRGDRYDFGMRNNKT